jgi:hypothetical protein
MPALSSDAFMSSTAALVGSRSESRRRKTVIGRITSRYLPRTYRSRRTSSAMPQMKFAIQLSWVCSIIVLARPRVPVISGFG